MAVWNEFWKQKADAEMILFSSLVYSQVSFKEVIYISIILLVW